MEGQHDVSSTNAETPAWPQGERVMASEERGRMIAEQAYYRYLRRSGESADAVSDWLAAEAEVDRQLLDRAPAAMELDGMERERDSFLRRMEDQLARWDSVLEEFRTRAQQKSTKLRTELLSQLSTLDDMRQGLRARLDLLRGCTGQAWTDLREGVEAAWDDMRSAVDRMAARFK